MEYNTFIKKNELELYPFTGGNVHDEVLNEKTNSK